MRVTDLYISNLLTAYAGRQWVLEHSNTQIFFKKRKKVLS